MIKIREWWARILLRWRYRTLSNLEKDGEEIAKDALEKHKPKGLGVRGYRSENPSEWL